MDDVVIGEEYIGYEDEESDEGGDAESGSVFVGEILVALTECWEEGVSVDKVC